MQHDVRREKLTEYMQRSVEMYLRNNADIFTNTFVMDVVLSEDMRRANVIIACGDKSEVKEILNRKKGEIADYSKRYFRAKYMPQITFIFNENLDF